MNTNHYKTIYLVCMSLAMLCLGFAVYAQQEQAQLFPPLECVAK